MTDTWSRHFPPTGPDGLLGQIWHMLGRLEEGQHLNRITASERAAELKDHVDRRIDDLKDSLVDRIERLERAPSPLRVAWDILATMPWRHMVGLAATGWLVVHGNFSAPEIKALALKILGLG